VLRNFTLVLVRVLLLVNVLGVSILSNAQTPGHLEPKVAIKADPQQTYALYLPAHFDASHRWPVLYLFDPGARGSLAAEHFRVAAERFGIIVAASNVSHNGPAQPSLDALQAMTLDVESRFPIDPLRRYIAGFSGGARASVIAAMVCPKCFAGVLGFGAGLPLAPKLSAKPDFLYLVGVGDDDFNYSEIMDLAPKLDQLKAEYRILTYEGTHDWPTTNATIEAVSWLHFQAVKHGALIKPATYPDSDWSARLATAREIASSNPVQAAREYEAMLRDFQSLHDTAEATSDLNRLRSSAQFKKAQKEERRIAARTQDASDSFDRYVQSMLSAVGAGEKQLPRTSAVQLINQMRTDSTSEDRLQSTVARRSLSAFYVTLLQTREQLTPTQTEALIDLANLACTLHPESDNAWYSLALAYLQAGNRRQSISALKKAIDLGTPKSRPEEDTRFSSLAADPDFKSLVAR
jgi:predicted esterase